MEIQAAMGLGLQDAPASEPRRRPSIGLVEEAGDRGNYVVTVRSLPYHARRIANGG